MRIAAFSLLAAGSLLAAPVYTVTPLNYANLTHVQALTDNGWLLGTAINTQFTANLNNPASYLIYPSPIGIGGARGISDTGQVTGWSLDGNLARAWVGDNGVWTELPGAGGPGTFAEAISANGLIVGGAIPTGSSFTQAAIWQNGALQSVPGALMFRRVSRSGNAMAGEAPPNTPHWSVFVRFNGVDSVVDSGGHQTDAYGINDLGIWVGFRYVAIGGGQYTTNIVVGDSSGFQVIQNPANRNASGVGNSINNAGQVIYNTTYLNGNYDQPYLWDAANGARTLSSLAGIPLNVVYAINNNGQIVASNGLQFYLLNPVPEPATWALLIAGLSAAALRRRAQGGSTGRA